MRKFPVVSGMFVAGALVVAACSSGSTSPTVPPVPTVPPIPSISIPTVPPISIPTVPPIPSISIPNGSFALPSFAFPSFNTNADPDLAAKFPTQVGGEPVTNVETVNFMEFFTAFGGLGDAYAQAHMQALVALLSSNGIDATKLSFGRGDTQINGDTVRIQAFRTPGAQATQLLALWPQLQAISSTDNTAPTQGTANVGGKNVTTFTASDGTVTYVYPSGDILWSTDTSDPTEAAAVFQALQ